MSSLLDAGSALHHTNASPIDLLIALFIAGLAPLLAVSMTSFTRIIVVLGLVRSALGTPSIPPNAVIAALALMLTCVIMRPTFEQINAAALAPYETHRIPPAQALAQAAEPLRAFMLRQARSGDIAQFERFSGRDAVKASAVPLQVVVPAFLVGELRAAFAMGFSLALPFAVIDIVVATTLTALGMFMVPPSAIALPIKLLLFVAADGWMLVAGALVASFR